jgi:MOSC domain-containing protein
VIVGRVAQLWRYPVKSMLGERLHSLRLTRNGFEADRSYALRDSATGRILSAKRESRLLQLRAKESDGRVWIKFPSGDDVSVDDPDAESKLGEWLGRSVEIARAPSGRGRSQIESEEGMFWSRPGSFFDARSVHLITAATLAALSDLYPEGVFDARRFRPNLFLETPPHSTGFVEETWERRGLAIGSEAVVDVVGPCSRCVMTTHGQEDLEVDRDILRTVRAQNEGNVGVYGIVIAEGLVSVGDDVVLR